MEERYSMVQLMSTLDELISDRENFIELIGKNYDLDMEKFYNDWFEKFKTWSNCLSLYYLHMDDTEKKLHK